uniref:Beta/gamma crystallin 'Greek key' domain-containing protein n=1 Tax=Gopherus agassizii TaxID=38772 RepID=A0A452H9Z2_9SAUR
MQQTQACPGHGIPLGKLSLHTVSDIILFEDRNFQGRSVECSSDRPDLQSHLSRCNSIRVESGCFMLYERPNFQGQQFFVKRGDYPDMQSEGFSTSIKSCRMIPPVSSILLLKHGNVAQATIIRHLLDHFQRKNVSSWTSYAPPRCSLVLGHGILYEMPNYRGRQYLLRPGQYRRFSEWGAMSGRVGSLRRCALSWTWNKRFPFPVSQPASRKG